MEKTKLEKMQSEIEDVIAEHFEVKATPGLAIAVTLPPNYDRVYWISNVPVGQAAMLFRQTANKIDAQTQ